MRSPAMTAMGGNVEFSCGAWRSTSRDEPGTAIARNVVVHPLRQHQQSILEFDEIHQVDEDPHEPGDESGDAKEAKIGDSFVAADGREVAFVEIVERLGRGTSGGARANEARHPAALLHRDWRESRQRL